MKNHFIELWKYNDWANKKVLSYITDNKIKNDKIVSLMSHILSAEFIWYLRIIEKPSSAFPVWEVYKITELHTMNEDITRNWLAITNELKDFESKVNYTNTKGEKYSSSIVQIMTHVINHGTHHRAQIASLLRVDGLQPPFLDYIFYTRE